MSDGFWGLVQPYFCDLFFKIILFVVNSVTSHDLPFCNYRLKLVPFERNISFQDFGETWFEFLVYLMNDAGVNSGIMVINELIEIFFLYLKL